MPEASRSIPRILPRPAALSVTDDAGATHRHEVPRLWFPWIIRERDAASRAVRREQMKTGWDQTTGTVMGLVMAPLLGGFAYVGLILGLPIYLIYAVAFIPAAGFAWVMWWVAHRRLERHWPSLGRQWTDAGLRRARCPLCLYSLAGARPDDHGLAQCAECGAAWQHDRFSEVSEREAPQWRRFINHMLGAEMRRSIRDDAGRTFAAERLRVIALRLREREIPEVTTVVASVRESSGAARRGTALLIALLILGLALLVFRSAVRLGPSPFTFVILLMLAACTAVVVGAIVCSDFGLTARSRRRQMLAAGLCPVCASPDLAPEGESDLSTCADCSAAWRVQAAQ